MGWIGHTRWLLWLLLQMLLRQRPAAGGDMMHARDAHALHRCATQLLLLHACVCTIGHKYMPSHVVPRKFTGFDASKMQQQG